MLTTSQKLLLPENYRSILDIRHTEVAIKLLKDYFEREDRITKDKGAVFVSKIGCPLRSGFPHDGRAPDYDDWKLNGDILFWFLILNRAVEVSSMGIRVDEETLIKQIRYSKCEERLSMNYHQDILHGRLPYTIGGGIGQSRMCMYFVNYPHL